VILPPLSPPATVWLLDPAVPTIGEVTRHLLVPGRTEPADPADIPWVVPRSRLPFRAVVVASRTDPYTTFAQFEQFAQDWSAELVDAGDVGHLDTASGFGPWPDGERLVSGLT
jgi:predicted alpha/beta hydrolase family esterase